MSPPGGGTDTAEAIKDLARRQSCAVLDTEPENGGGPENGKIRVRGLARLGPAWEAFLREAKSLRPAALNTSGVTFLPPHACSIADTLGAATRDTRASPEGPVLGAPPLLLFGKAGGTEEGTAVLSLLLRRPPGTPLALDVFQPDGMVQHLIVRTREAEGNATRVIASFPRLPMPGTLVFAVLTAAASAGVERAPVEWTDAYLASLRNALAKGTGLDLAVFDSRVPASGRLPVANAPVQARPVTAVLPRPVAAHPANARPIGARPAQAIAAPHPAGRPPRCGAILERAQLGEGLSEGDRAFLRAACR